MTFITVTKNAQIIATLSFLWYDFWVGAFYDQKKNVLYVCPLPCVVFAFYLKAIRASKPNNLP